MILDTWRPDLLEACRALKGFAQIAEAHGDIQPLPATPLEMVVASPTRSLVRIRGFHWVAVVHREDAENTTGETLLWDVTEGALRSFFPPSVAIA